MEEPGAGTSGHRPDPDDPPAADGLGAVPSLDRLADDLADVERALERLEDGTYWTDEVTGEPIPDEVLTSDPAARRAPDRRPGPPG